MSAPATKAFRYFVQRTSSEPPYGFTGEPHVVMPATCKTGLGAAKASMIPHIVASAASVIIDGTMTFAARWECGGSSVDVIFLEDPVPLGGVCARCGDPDWPAEPGVYWLFDHDGALIYLGSSSHLRKRLAQHHTASPFRERIAEVTYTTYPTELDAKAAEAALLAGGPSEVNKVGTARTGSK